MAYQRTGYYDDNHEMSQYDDPQRYDNPFAGGDLAENGGYARHYAHPSRPPLPPTPVGQPQGTPYARAASASPPAMVEQTSWQNPYANPQQSQEPNSLTSQPPYFPSQPQHSFSSSYALHDPGVQGHTPAAPEEADEDPLLENPGYSGGTFAGSYPGGYASQSGTGDEQGNLVRYGKIPSRQPRRFKTVKRVELSNGNLVLDCPVPEKLLQMCTLKNEREFTHMRCAYNVLATLSYLGCASAESFDFFPLLDTAATCDPDDFMSERYTLRQVLYGPARRTGTLRTPKESIYDAQHLLVLQNCSLCSPCTT